jgi:hypothetical protein
MNTYGSSILGESGDNAILVVGLIVGTSTHDKAQKWPKAFAAVYYQLAKRVVESRGLLDLR